MGSPDNDVCVTSPNRKTTNKQLGLLFLMKKIIIVLGSLWYCTSLHTHLTNVSFRGLMRKLWWTMVAPAQFWISIMRKKS